MGRRSLYWLSSVLIAAAVAGAGCGASSRKAANPTKASSKATVAAAAPASSRSQGGSSQDDCQMLYAVASDLAAFDNTGTGFNYVKDRSFLDGYASRAPGGIAASVRQMRDLVDRVASAARDAGVAVNEDPSEDELHKIQDELHFSADEQSRNAAALSQLATYAGTSSSC